MPGSYRHDRDKGTVSFGYKDYADGSRKKSMTLSEVEFARRFALHILPKGFCKIRHYGILSTRNRKAKLARCRFWLGVGNANSRETEPQSPAGYGDGDRARSRHCPFCESEQVDLIAVITPWFTRRLAGPTRGPPGKQEGGKPR